MTYNRTGRAARGAFTLTEILVVILIIALLVSLTAAGVMKVLNQGPQLRTTNDITQLGLAIQQFEQEYNVPYIPSYFIIREDNEWNLTNPAELNCYNYLKRVFGKNINLTPVSKGGPGIDWNGNLTIDPSGPTGTILQGQHCLVFFLGGIPSTQGGVNACLGFSTSPTNPATLGGTRRGPFYQNWEAARLVQDTNGFFVYRHAWKQQKVGDTWQPYAYFSAYGVQNGYKNSWGILNQSYYKQPTLGDCPSLLTAQSPTPVVLQPYNAGAAFANPNTYQIISAGKDNLFGSGGAWNPAGGGCLPQTVALTTGQSVNNPNNDNQTNFAKGILEAGQ